MPRSHTHESRRGLTLAELVVVLAILATLGSLLLPAVGHFVNDSRADVTRVSLARLREVIAGLYWSDANGQLPQPNPGVSPSRVDAPQVRYLFVNPATEDAAVTFNPAYKLGWRGPYVVNQSGASYRVMDPTAQQHGASSDQYGVGEVTSNGVTMPGDPTVLDGWGNPIVIQNPGQLADGRLDVRLVSAGPNGTIDTPPTVATSALTAAQMDDDIVISFGVR
jgi:prepilin-type N-terminal cleavage/methylation domain-containing protein